MRDFNDRARPPPATGKDHQKALVKLITGLSHRHSQWQVFSDFAEMGAISISNAVDIGQLQRREARYMEIVSRYKPDEITVFPQMLGELVMALEAEPADVMGATFHDLELHNKWAGQFFSPYTLCRMIGKTTLSGKEDIEARIRARGFVTAQEPAAGSGAMVIALAHEMREVGINYQQHLHVTATDIDLKCVHMAYLQFSLLHIPAVIVHGNSLTLEARGHWYTPAHIMDGWKWKLRRAAAADMAHDVLSVPAPEAPEPDTKRDSGLSPPVQLTLF